jgi:hypothetical protein
MEQKVKQWIAAVVLLAAGQGATALDVAPRYFFSAGELANTCSKALEGAGVGITCGSYLAGVNDTITNMHILGNASQFAPKVCTLSGTTPRMLARAFMQHMNQHPDQREWSASGVALKVMAKAWPCK